LGVVIPDSREECLLEELHQLRSNFPSKYQREMTVQEKRALDFAEQLLKLKVGKGKAAGE
jgi:hypothetical protein